MKKQHIASLISVALFGAASFSALAQNAAVVNGKPVPAARVEQIAQQVKLSGRQITPEIQAQIKEEVIAREIFVQEAQKLGLENTEDFKAQMKAQIELATQTTLIRELFSDHLKKNPISDADIKAEYDKLVAANYTGKEYRARHILVDKEAEAKAIIASLKKGGKFDEIAKKQSKDTGSGSKGGELDWNSPNSYVKEFSDAMVKLAKGQTTDTPVKSQFGYHVIRLDDVRDAQPPKLDDNVKQQIAQKLQQEKIAKFQSDLRAKAKVE